MAGFLVYDDLIFHGSPLRQFFDAYYEFVDGSDDCNEMILRNLVKDIIIITITIVTIRIHVALQITGEGDSIYTRNTS